MDLASLRRLAPEHTYFRHVGGSQIGANGRPDGSAFRLKPKDLDGLSGTWSEFYGSDKPASLRQIRSDYRAAGRKIGANSMFAELNVRVSTAAVAEDPKALASIEFVHSPEPGIPAHAIIVGYEISNLIAADALALSVQAMHPGLQPE